MPRYRISEEARAEILDAFDYLRQQSPELPKYLSRLIRGGLAEIAEHPRRYPYYVGKYRKYRLDPFKYALLYREMPDGNVNVASFWHLMRDERRLRSRLEDV